MKGTTEAEGSVVVVALGRRLTIEEDLGALELRVEGLLRDGCGGLVFDFGGRTRLDAAGLGQLVRLRSLVLDVGGRLCLLNVPRREEDLLEICNLASVFRILDSETEAVASVRPSELHWRPEPGGLTKLGSSPPVTMAPLGLPGEPGERRDLVTTGPRERTH